MNSVINFNKRSASTHLRPWVGALICGLSILAGCEDDDGGVLVDASTPTPDAAAPTPDAQTPDAIRPDSAPTTDAAVTPATADLDVVLVRLNADGTRDNTFGTNGIARIDFGPGGASSRDALWGVKLDAMGRVVLFGSRKAADPRVDNDRVVARLTTAGALDTTFGMNGFHTLNIANLGDNARHGIVQPDGKIVSSGYTAQPTGVGTQDANRIVLARLLDTGMPDTTFGVGGVVNAAPFVPAMPDVTPWGMAEAYGVALQSTGGYVTTGYGRSAAMGTVDMVSFRFGADGKRDATWGGTGSVVFDLTGADDRGRNILALGNDGIVIVGSAKPTATSMDSLVIKLLPTGMRDAAYGTDGAKLYDFGRATDEPFYGVALSADKNWVAATGYTAETGGATPVDTDATLLLLPVGAGGGTEVIKTVPASETESDGFYGAAFDAAGKAYGAGYVRDGADSLMLVSRFNMDGTPDTTFAGGVVKVNVVVAGAAEIARDVVIQADGKVDRRRRRRGPLIQARVDGHGWPLGGRARRTRGSEMNRDRIVVRAGLAGLLALVGAACGDSGAGPVDGAGPPAMVDGGGSSPPPADSADAAAAPGGLPEGFMALAPCLTPDRYVAAPTAIATVGFTYAPACLRVARGSSVTIEASAVHPLEPGPNGSPGQPDPAREQPGHRDLPARGLLPLLLPGAHRREHARRRLGHRFDVVAAAGAPAGPGLRTTRPLFSTTMAR